MTNNQGDQKEFLNALRDCRNLLIKDLDVSHVIQIFQEDHLLSSLSQEIITQGLKLQPKQDHLRQKLAQELVDHLIQNFRYHQR